MLKQLLIIISILFSIAHAQREIRIHGYLTQGVAMSSQAPIFGIPTDGTSDYRNLALQFRTGFNNATSAVVQFSHKRLGKSPLMQTEESVELDWGFLEYQFNKDWYFKAGLIQLPYGIYNETRDVGILLPFYQVPYTPYGEGNYTSETVSGIMIGYKRGLGDWGMTLDLYGGEWSWTDWVILSSPFQEDDIVTVEEAFIKQAIGGQFWLETPINDLRLGLAGYIAEARNGVVFNVIGPQKLRVGLISFDSQFESFLFRSEFSAFATTGNGITGLTYYAHAGVHLKEWMTVHAHYGDGTTRGEQLALLSIRQSEFNLLEEFALGVNFTLHHNFILKLETHWTDSFLTETPQQPGNIYLESIKTNYSIISLSTAF